MFKFGPQEKNPLEKAIDQVIREMENETADSAEFAKMNKQLVKLYKLQAQNKKRVNPDTIAIVAGNLAGIVIIVSHERMHVLTSKAVQFILKAAR